jgi:predicted transcriptional regulator
LNLTPNEEKVYTALLRNSDADPLELSKVTQLPRTRIYDILSKLALKHLLDRKEDGYRVIPPKVAIKYIKEELSVSTENKISALNELSNQINEVWKNGTIEIIKPGVEISSFHAIEQDYLHELSKASKRVFIAASNNTGGIDWGKSGQTLARTYNVNLDFRYLYSDIAMAKRMVHAFKHFVPFSNFNIMIKSNEELESSFILLDNKLYIFFIGVDTLETKVLSVSSSQLVLTFDWLFHKLWDAGIES